MVRFEARDGSQHLWLSPILRTKTGVALADPMEMPEPPWRTVWESVLDRRGKPNLHRSRKLKCGRA